MYPKAKPHEEAEHQNKTRTPEEAAAALNEIEDRRRQIAPEVARRIYPWALLAVMYLLGSLSFKGHSALIVVALLFLATYIGAIRGKSAGEIKTWHQLKAFRSRSAKVFIATVYFFEYMLFNMAPRLVDHVFHWSHFVSVGRIMLAVLVVITGPLVQRAITAMLSRGRP